jgi:hypothetical protein
MVKCVLFDVRTEFLISIIQTSFGFNDRHLGRSFQATPARRSDSVILK